MGGGSQAVALTADLVARAIIAAARSFGDDPVMACTSRAKDKRRSLVAAAGGLAVAGICTARRASAVLGLNPTSVGGARCGRRENFDRAQTAAAEAVRSAAEPPPALPAAHPAPNLDKLREAVRKQPAREIPITTTAAPLARRAAATAPAKGLNPTPSATPRSAGPVSAGLSPPPPRALQVAAADRPVTELVLEALADGERRDSMSLSSMLDRKEMAVVSALSQLKSERKVVEEPCEGPRRFRYRMAAAAEASA
jgi:hypothetical protein